MIKKQIIKYSKIFDELPDVKSAKNFIPDWFKKTEIINAKTILLNKTIFNKKNHVNKNVKNCMPFFDSLSSGYMLYTWVDIYCEKTDSGPFYRWQIGPEPIDERAPGSNNLIPIPSEFHSNHLIWNIHYSFQLPKGYSALITHPFNRMDLPFTTLTGIVDMDKIMPPGGIPFFMKKDFYGIIPKGTPFAQIIPFKRENWKIEDDHKLKQKGLTEKYNSLSVFFNYYKDNKWNKKTYE